MCAWLCVVSVVYLCVFVVCVMSVVCVGVNVSKDVCVWYVCVCGIWVCVWYMCLYFEWCVVYCVAYVCACGMFMVSGVCLTDMLVLCSVYMWYV